MSLPLHLKRNMHCRNISRFTVIFFFIAISFVAIAQSHYTSRVSLGVKGGVDFSRVFFNPSVKQSMLTGAVAGVTFIYIEETHFGLIAELNF